MAGGGRKSRGGGKSKKKKGGRDSGSGGGRPSSSSTARHHPPPHNFLPSAGPGCHIASDPSLSSWVLGSEPFDPDDYDPGVNIPDIGLDPYENNVSVTNTGTVDRVCYVTVFDVPCLGRDGRRLEIGLMVGDDGVEKKCTTLIVLCPPSTFVHLCKLDLPEGMTMAEVRIESDMSEANPHPDPEDEHPAGLAFPLSCRDLSVTASDGIDGDENDVAEPSYVCTQGEGGHLTHFLRGNYHAIDFRCRDGTPVLAAGEGTVVEVRDSHRLTGVAVGNLYEWNSVMIELDVPSLTAGDDPDSVGSAGVSTPSDNVKGGPLFVEYVHIQHKSSVVKVGDRVKRGQILCRSGSVGFSPEPHLHFSAFRSKDPAAPTVRVQFEPPRGEGGEAKEKVGFIPRAGLRYNQHGVVDEKATSVR